QLPRFERRGHRCGRWAARDAKGRAWPSHRRRSRPSAPLRCSPPRAAVHFAIAAAALRALRLGARTVLAACPGGGGAARRLRRRRDGPALSLASCTVASRDEKPVVATATVNGVDGGTDASSAVVIAVSGRVRARSHQPRSL